MASYAIYPFHSKFKRIINNIRCINTVRNIKSFNAITFRINLKSFQFKKRSNIFIFYLYYLANNIIFYNKQSNRNDIGIGTSLIYSIVV